MKIFKTFDWLNHDQHTSLSYEYVHKETMISIESESKEEKLLQGLTQTCALVYNHW